MQTFDRAGWEAEISKVREGVLERWQVATALGEGMRFVVEGMRDEEVEGTPGQARRRATFRAPSRMNQRLNRRPLYPRVAQPSWEAAIAVVCAVEKIALGRMTALSSVRNSPGLGCDYPPRCAVHSSADPCAPQLRDSRARATQVEVAAEPYSAQDASARESEGCEATMQQPGRFPFFAPS